MDENQNINEQEIYLEPEKQKLVNVEEILQLSMEMKKHDFIIRYLSGEKDILTSELERIGCNEMKSLDFMNCVAVSLNIIQLKAIKTLDCVTQVERDYEYRCLWYGNYEAELAKHLAGENPNVKKSKEVKFALFDTGVFNCPVDGSVSFISNVSEERNSHGTQMAEIVLSVLTDTENIVAKPSIYSVVVVDHKGFAKTSTIMEALNWAINNKIKVINMSFGDYHKSTLLEEMINRASNCGIIMIAAAGNDGSFKDEYRIMYPAAFTNVLSVGAKHGEAVAPYSSGGMDADCFANGTQTGRAAAGNQVSIISTSGAAAFVAGMILKKFCIDPEKSASDISKCIKSEMSMAAGEENASSLTRTVAYDTIATANESVAPIIDDTTPSEADNTISVQCIENGGDCGCFSNDMASAINLPFINWQRGRISCPGADIWYKFTANISDAHPNGSPGWYIVHTQGSLDTIGYLYDSYGNQIAFNDDNGSDMSFRIWTQLNYGETYFLRVKAYGNNTGDFDVRVSYLPDDHGNTPETATQVTGVYYEDKSVSGYLHSESDVDYYAFVPARNCVMEIYTEGDTNTYGQLYCASGGLLDSDTNGNGNGNFKITAHLEGMKWYYIAVSHNSSDGYGDYTLRFKFVKDMLPAHISPNGATWINDSYDKDVTELSVQQFVYMNNEDSIRWGIKLQQSTFIETIKTLASQDVNRLIEELILQGFSTTFAYNMAGLIVNILEILQPSLHLAEFYSVYSEYQDSGYMGFVLAQCWTQKVWSGVLFIYNYEEMQAYAHHGNSSYMYGYPYARGHFEYH